MNACKIFLSIIFIMFEDIQNISCSTASEISYDFFHTNTKIIHDTMNIIFTSLRLKKSFKETPKIRLLLTMHKNLINVLKKSYKNSAIENNIDNMTIKEFPKHDNIIDEILEEEYLLLFFSPNETNQYDLNETTFDESLSEHLSGHLIQFLIKIDEITSRQPKTKDETSNNNNFKADYNTWARKSFTRNTPRNLKAWVPDPYQNFAFNRRIYRSKSTKIKKYPFMASVHVSGTFVCAGSLISKELIITAASCLQIPYFYRNNKAHQNNVTVRIGSEFTVFGGQSVPISSIYFHPQYNPDNLKHNLAILRMSKDQRFPKKKIRRVLFDKTSDVLPSDVKQVTIVGWGAKDEKNTQEATTKLSLAHLDLYKLDECKVVYSNSYVTESNFCAGFVVKASGACDKDVGDPAVVAGVLVGVVSFGPPLCGTIDAPTVFTRIGIYAGWIDSILKMDPTATATTKDTFRIPVGNPQGNPGFNLRGNPGLNLKGVNRLGPIRLDYPEEFFILKEILTDIATSNNSDINAVIDEGFEEEFFELMTTPKTELKHHPLANRTLYGIPGANFPQETYFAKQQPMNMWATTNAYGLVPNQAMGFKDYQKFGEMMDVMYHQQVGNLPSKSKLGPPVLNQAINSWIGRERFSTPSFHVNHPGMRTKPIFSDNIDAASGNYEGTGSEEGMSIEVSPKMTPTSKVLFDSNYNDFSRDYDTVKKTTRVTGETADYKNIFFVMENTAKIVEYTKMHPKPQNFAIGDQNYNNNQEIFGKTKSVFVNEDEDYSTESQNSASDEFNYYINTFTNALGANNNKFTKAFGVRSQI